MKVLKTSNNFTAFKQSAFSKIPKEKRAQEAKIAQKESYQAVAYSLAGGLIAGGATFLYSKYKNGFTTRKASLAGVEIGAIFSIIILLAHQTISTKQRINRIKTYQSEKQNI